MNFTNSKQFKMLLKHKPGMFGLGIVLLLVILAILANLIAPADPNVQNFEMKFIPPIWMEGGQWPYIFGTDVLGRDLFSRILYGARLSLLIGGLAVFTGAIIGVPLGMVSGYYGGKVDTLIMRVIDIMLAFSFPTLSISNEGPNICHYTNC